MSNVKFVEDVTILLILNKDKKFRSWLENIQLLSTFSGVSWLLK